MGFDKDRFVNIQGEQFDCPICSEVVEDPKECTGCGQLFCQGCIDSWLAKSKQCTNRCDAKTTQIRPIQGAILRIYKNLEIKCKFPQCGKVSQLSEIQAHEQSCGKPSCQNFNVCQNKTHNQIQGKPYCSQPCYLQFSINQIKDEQEQYKFIKKFLEENFKQSQSISVIQNSDQVIFKPNPNANIGGGQFIPINSIPFGQQKFRWSNINKGTGMELSEDNTRVWLKETAYMFRTIISDQPMTSGIYYWEIIADERTENELKIGISTKGDFNFNTAFCDFEYGYAFYGLGQLRHNSNASGPQYGKRFKKEGVLGLCLNMNKGQLSFSLNGEFMGVAYTAEALKKGPIWAAASLLHCAGCKMDSSKPVPSYFPQ